MLWRHSGPLCVAFHIVSSFSLLLPIILMDAQKIKYEFLSPGAIWRTELDALVDKEVMPGFVISPSSGNLTPPQAPSMENLGNQWEVLSPEFVNYLLALIIFSVRYPSVFWYTNMAFSLIFSFQLLVASMFYIFAYCSMAMLYKFQVNSEWRPDMKLMLPSSVILVLYLISNIFVYFSSIAIFNYGYHHYDEAYKKAVKSRNRLQRSLPAPPPTGCQGYIPHTMATVALVLFVACRAPLVYDCVTVYRRTGHPISLASIVWDVCYMFFWIIMWFCFTVKQTWNFKVRLDKTTHPGRAEVYMLRSDHADGTVVTVNGPISSDSVDSSPSNGNVISIDSSTPSPTVRADQSSDSIPSSPTSAMRKSGERRHNNVRVTFEDSGENQNELNNEIESSESSRRRHKDRVRTTPQGTPTRKRRKKGEDRDSAEPTSSVNEVAPPSDDSLNTPSASMFGGFPRGGTPENTLTRNYRHSIRDKCGQYYRHSREFKSPPAAQSSPVLAQRSSTDKTLNSTGPKPPELVLNPNMKSRDGMLPRRPSPSRTPIGGLDKPRHPSPVRASSVERTMPPSVERTMPPSADRTMPPSVDRTMPPSVDRTMPPSGDHMRHNALAAQHKRQHSSSGNSRSHKRDSYHTPVSRSSENVALRNSVTRDLSRELRIMTHSASKPEMGRRDSALPSSNETSSNDSAENVLCSQV